MVGVEDMEELAQINDQTTLSEAASPATAPRDDEGLGAEIGSAEGQIEWWRNLAIKRGDKIKALKESNDEMAQCLKEGRDYLMQIDPAKMTVEDALVAFGWDSNGF